MQAVVCEGRAERMDFVRVIRPPEVAPLMDRVSMRPSRE
jgi:hypothetical protein